MLDLAVIVVSWNVRRFLADCLGSVYLDLAGSGLHGAVWVVDNGSKDGSPALVAERFPQARLIANSANPGFGAANNQGMAAAAAEKPRFYLLLNPDTLVRPGALAALVTALDERPSAGMAGPRLVYGDGRFQPSAFRFPGLVQLAYDLLPLPARWYDSRWNGRYPRQRFQPDQPPLPVDCILGAAMLVRREVAATTGGFDERFYMYGEEIDWCWRIQEAGWQIYAVPSAEIVHFGGESTRQLPAPSLQHLWQSRARLYRKHHGRLTLAAARRLARFGLRRQAARTTDDQLRRAYLAAAAAWAAPEQTGGSDG